ncbi:hypothetical protein ACHAC9_21745 [Massilia sp. CMS3.1]|uniref:hypothetical protein n=1 Tax=Massilia sp. CMS3.1 TaxID=3373083 RepID=UPI003EE7B664
MLVLVHAWAGTAAPRYFDIMKFFVSILLALGLSAGHSLAANTGDVRVSSATKTAQQNRVKKKISQRRDKPSYAAQLGALKSSAVLILDPRTKRVLYQKNAHAALPIASLTKLMTALVVVEGGQSMVDMLSVTRADIDRLKYSSSRLQVGTRLSRAQMLHIALMSSENRAASALGVTTLVERGRLLQQ